MRAVCVRARVNEGGMRTCCCLATCSLSFVACFLMASISEGEREREVLCVCLEVLKLFQL